MNVLSIITTTAQLKILQSGVVKRCREFRSSQQGNVAITTMIGSLALFAGVGAALDYSAMTNAKSQMQNAVDTGVLAAATLSGETERYRINYGEDMIADNLINLNVKGETSTKVTIGDDGSVTGTVQLNYKPLWAKVLNTGPHKISVIARSMSQGFSDAEIVFVLDYSSSMNSRHSAMKNAAIGLIDDLGATSTSGFEFGLVPFAEEVYMQVDGRYIVGGTPGVPWEGCTMSRKWPFVITDKSPNGSPKSRWGHVGTDCSEYTSRNLRVRPLDSDLSAIKTQLNSMRPHSGTNTTVGVEIGFQMLSPNLPFSASAYGEKDKFLIVLSDGEQTRASFGPGDRFTHDQAEANLQSLCQQARAKGITVITMLYETGNSNARAAMQKCASRPEFFMTATTGSISQKFADIGKMVKSDIRLSQ